MNGIGIGLGEASGKGKGGELGNGSGKEGGEGDRQVEAEALECPPWGSMGVMRGAVTMLGLWSRNDAWIVRPRRVGRR